MVAGGSLAGGLVVKWVRWLVACFLACFCVDENVFVTERMVGGVTQLRIHLMANTHPHTYTLAYLY